MIGRLAIAAAIMVCLFAWPVAAFNGPVVIKGGGGGLTETLADALYCELDGCDMTAGMSITAAVDLTTTSNGDLTLDPHGTGTCQLASDTTITGGLTMSGASVDITTVSNQNLFLSAHGTGGLQTDKTLTFGAVATDITAGNNENITVDPLGTGVFEVAGGALITGSLSISASSDIITPGVENLFINPGGDVFIDKVLYLGNSVDISTAANQTLTLSANGTGLVESQRGLKLTPSGSKPTCNSGARSTLWITQGGAGVADTLEWCKKDGADAYAWTSIP